MFGRFIKNESGMTMALTVVMIVLIGVMGAGILTFVQRDLESVIEVNRGQRAFELADAGAQAGKRQLLSDAVRQHYDTSSANDCDPKFGQRSGDDWSPATIGSNADCSDTSVSKPSGPGVTRDFAGGKFEVTIQCFDQTGDSTPDPCVGGLSPAPETTSADDKMFFKVISTGFYPADESGAKRKIEAIYNTEDTGVPRAYYSPSEVNFNGSSSCLKNVSVFSLGDIDLPNDGQCPGDGYIYGVDYAYGNWKNSFNSTPRTKVNADGTYPSGLGTPQDVKNDSNEVSGRDYDGDVPNAAYPKFIKDVPSTGQTSTQITFPFDYKTQQGQADDERLDFYEEIARQQEADTGENHYIEISSNGNPPLSSWPANSSYNTVVYVKFTNANPGQLKWDVPGGCDDASRKRGILVVDNGDFGTQPDKTLFSGTVIVRGGTAEPVGDYADSGNTCIEGFANADGTITVSGSTNASSTPELAYSPGFYKMQLWSWRELYK